MLSPSPIRVRATSDTNASYEKALTIYMGNQNEAPTIHKLGNITLTSLSEEIPVYENLSIAFDLNASDPDGDTLTYSKTGGADRHLFDLNASTGRLSLSVNPDYENPQDADGNNTYIIWLRVNDGNGANDEKRLRFLRPKHRGGS